MTDNLKWRPNCCWKGMECAPEVSAYWINCKINKDSVSDDTVQNAAPSDEKVSKNFDSNSSLKLKRKAHKNG